MTESGFQKLLFVVLGVFSLACVSLLYVVASHESEMFEKCLEAGGVPASKTHYSPLCFNPSALIELK